MPTFRNKPAWSAAAAAHRAVRRFSGAVAGKKGIYVCAAVGHFYETTAARYQFADPSFFASFEDYSITDVHI
jgi:hypothetical protein